MIPRSYFVFDVESVGLHGEGFAVGWVLVTAAGEALRDGMWWCDPGNAAQAMLADREWVLQNVPPLSSEREASMPRDVRLLFWDEWLRARREHDAVLAADVAWPVEARFLFDCIADDPRRAVDGPYPLVDIASVRLARGFDPLATEYRLPSELPRHNPLADARQSARLLLGALRVTREEAFGDASTMVLNDTPRNLK